MPKRPPFFFFMQEVQKVHAKNGHNYSMSEMPQVASPVWEKMTKEEKARYEEMARKFNGQPRQSTASTSGGIKTCHGIDHAVVEREQRREAMQVQKMKEDVANIIKQATLNQSLRHKTFYLLHINYFCESSDANGEKSYSAAEVAIQEFSLQDGLKRAMHTHIKLETIPLGYFFEAQRHTNATHQLPLPPNTIGKTTIREAVQEVLCFIGLEDGVSPPIFTADLPVAQTIFGEVLDQVATISAEDVRIYAISELLFHLKNATHSQAVALNTMPPFTSIFLADSYLKRETFDYVEGLPCEFHHEIDRVPYCSQTKIKGWAFSIILSCAPDLQIEFVEGKHEPENVLGKPPAVVKHLDDDSYFTPPVVELPKVERSFHHEMPADPLPSIVSSLSSFSFIEQDQSAGATNTEAFPRVQQFRRGKGRGNLL